MKGTCAALLTLRVGKSRFLFLILSNEAVDIDDTTECLIGSITFINVVDGSHTRCTYLLLLLGGLLGLFDALSGSLYDRVGDSLFHEVDLTLTNELHVSIGKRNQQLLLALFA